MLRFLNPDIFMDKTMDNECITNNQKLIKLPKVLTQQMIEPKLILKILKTTETILSETWVLVYFWTFFWGGA